MEPVSASAVQSLDRVFQIIEYLSKHPKGISLTDICAATQLPKSTVSRMLASLIIHGYAAQDSETKKYMLTTRLFEIGSRAIGGKHVLSVALPYLERLTGISDEVTHLVIRVGSEILYLHKEDASTSLVRMSSCIGLRNPMYCTGVGKSIMAFLPDDEIRSIWNDLTPIQFTPNTITSFDRMQRELAQIREMGYAIDDEEHELGVRCIAAPIFEFDGNPFAAISLSAPAIRLNDNEIRKYAPMVLDAAKSISRFFGSDV